jgi:hypothetical protein
VAAIGSAVGMALLIAFPKAMYPTTRVSGMDHWLAITVIAIAWTDIALAALAYQHDVVSTVRAVMGLVGSGFTGGTAMLGFLLAAEVIAAAAVVSEAALIYVARKRNMAISLAMLALEAGLAIALILIMRDEGLPQTFQATGPAIALCVSLGFASIAKSLLARKMLGAPVSGWRWDLAWATACGVIVGAAVRLLLPETWQLVVGVPVILIAFFAVLWTKGFGPEDRELFRLKKHEVRELREAEDAAEARDQVQDDIV